MPLIVNADVPCATCGYNLRMQPANGRCPECATLVGPSLNLALGRTNAPRLERFARDFTFHAAFHISALILIVFIAFASALEAALCAYPILIIVYANLTYTITAPFPGEPPSTLARNIRIGIVVYIAGNLLTIIAVAVNIMTHSDSNLVLIPIILVVIAPSAITVCKGHYIAQLSRRALFKTFAPWSIRISYSFAAALLAWMSCLLYYSGLSRIPQPFRAFCLTTSSTLIASACVAASIFYLLLADRFRKLAAASVNASSLTIEQPDATPTQPD